MATQQIEIRAVDKTQAALRNVNRNLNQVQSSLLSVNKIAAIAVTALGAIGGANIIRGIANTTARYQDLETTLSSVTGSAQKGAEAFDFVSKFATKTQFGIEELAVAYTKLQSNGITPTANLLTTFTDAAAVTTDQLGSLTAITDFYTRTLQSQQVELMDLDRLADRGLPVYDILKEKLGVSRSELSKFSKEAGNAELVVKALGDGINQRFGGATEARLANLSTAMSNFSIATKNVQNAIGEGGLGPAMTELINLFNGMLERALPLAKIIGEELGFAVFKMTKFLKESNFDMGQFIMGAKIAAAVLGGAGLVAILKSVTAGIKAMTLALARNPIGLLAVAAASAITYLSMENGLGKTIAQVGAVLNKVGEAFSALGSYLQDVFVKVINFIKNKFYDFIDAIIASYNAVARLVPFLEETDMVSRELAKTVGDGVASAYQAVSMEVKEFIADKSEELGITALIKKAHEEGTNVLNELTKAYQDAGLSYEQAEAAAREEYNTRVRGIPAYDDAIVRLAKIEGGNEKVASSFKKASGATSEFETKLKNAIKKYDEYIFSTTEIAERGIAEDLKIFDDALEKKLISQEQYNELVLGMDKKLKEAQMKAEEDLTAKNLEELRKRTRAVIEAGNGQLSAEDRKTLQQIGQNEKLEEAVNKRIEFEKKSEFEKAQFMIDSATDSFKELGKQNKQAFEAYKAFAIAKTIMDTYSGARAAFTSLAHIPVIGVPLGIAAAAAAVAAGMAQVNMIRSQTYSGRQRGGNVNPGQPVMVGEGGPEMIVPRQPATVIPNEVARAMEGMGGPVNVNFNINTVDAADFDSLLVERRGTIVGIINQAMERRGKVGVA